MKITDRLVQAISPKRLAERVAYRLRAQQLLNIEANSTLATVPRSDTRWRGASQTLRSMVSWIVNYGSGRTDTSRAERERMAARSYDAYRNHLIGRAAIKRTSTNVVGTGLQMHPAVDADALGISEEEADKLNRIIKREHTLYYDNPYEVDIEGTLDGAGLQMLALVTALLGGDCWASTPYEERPGCLYGLKLQLIDPARVSNQNDGPDTTTLQDGVELSLNGMPMAIHVRNRHPGDTMTATLPEWERREIYAPSGERRIFQIWNDKDRIGVTRGVPYLAPILEPLQTLEQYTRSELLATVVSSMFTVFIQKGQQFDERGNPIPAFAAQTKEGESPAEPSQLALGPAAVVDLGQGEIPHFANPSRPSARFDPFFLAVCRQIGASLELPLDVLLLNYQSSYSAARAAMLEAWRFFTTRRWWLVQQLCQPHFRLWFAEAVARGRIPATNFADPARRLAYTNAIWIGPARGAMDEGQEASAAKTRIETGISNESIECAQMTGESWADVYGQRKREILQRRKDGMELGPSPGQAAAPGKPAVPGAEDRAGRPIPAGIDDDEEDDNGD